jgi:hypothetical protein
MPLINPYFLRSFEMLICVNTEKREATKSNKTLKPIHTQNRNPVGRCGVKSMGLQ